MTIKRSSSLGSISNIPQVPTFFASFPGFDHHPNSPVSKEFTRLAQWRGWKDGSKNWRKNWNHCMGEQYDSLIGSRVNDLATWQQMCRKLDIAGDFPSINKCRKALSHVYVNLVDLLECWEDERSPTLFKSAKQLSNYTKSQNKFFGRQIAKQDKALRTLLKRIN
ncbi:hypothetical protein N7451_004818 [Penicillium sp. IBT 35674x]|nr:hypothetical protein N7451_004818 [Penicillium sp. IBT 35674x]